MFAENVCRECLVIEIYLFGIEYIKSLRVFCYMYSYAMEQPSLRIKVHRLRLVFVCMFVKRFRFKLHETPRGNSTNQKRIFVQCNDQIVFS